ncbi:MAG: glycoside hydrolase family 2 TIM barrel-domain containing protein [Candidatus Alcyoniella australis]|nr:glycoside hydrolase family 2 TIM barrel-domain containing protein [Candidatus Alcyoniella australis]
MTKRINARAFPRALFAVWMLVIMFAGCDAGGDDDQDNGDQLPAPLLIELGAAPDEVPLLWGVDQPYPTRFDSTHRDAQSLDGRWLFTVDPDDQGFDQAWYSPQYDRADWDGLEVPGSWNALRPELFRYRGPAWYARGFTVAPRAGRTRLRFGAAFLRAQVWVNGSYVGSHSGGYTPFEIDVTDVIRHGQNLVVVRVDNRITRETIPCLTLANSEGHGWYPWGGLTRSVVLERVDEPYVAKVDPGASVDPQTSRGSIDARIVLHRMTLGSTDATVRVLVEDLEGRALADSGQVALEPFESGSRALAATAELGEVELWDHNTPQHQYQLRVIVESESGRDETVSRLGFRSFEVRGPDLYLNGRREWWRGMNRHEDWPGVGAAQSDESIVSDVASMLDLGVNHLRPAHYPPDPRFLDACRDAGISLTLEVPVYQLDLWQLNDEALRLEAQQQLAEMIERDRNNPAIVAWSLSNEIWSMAPSAELFMSGMNATAKRFDPRRPTMVVLVGDLLNWFPEEFATSNADIVGVNIYLGWYSGTLGAWGPFLDSLEQRFADRPLVISEFGTGALQGRHLPAFPTQDEPLDDHSYSEEFQAVFLQNALDAVVARPWIDGTMPWSLTDFRYEWVPDTGVHPIPFRNLKGLLSLDRIPKLGYEFVRLQYQALAADELWPLPGDSQENR